MSRTLRASILAASAGCAFLSSFSAPSSHREGPFITKMPKVDATDFYMFRSYEPGRENFVTLVANYQPGQNPYDGPNYYMFDQDAQYQIHIDNDGDGREDITFSFRFGNSNKDLKLNVGGTPVSIPLIQAGPVTSQSTANLNVVEGYTMNVVYDDQGMGTSISTVNGTTGSNRFEKPVDYIGTKTLPDYDAYTAGRIYPIQFLGHPTPGRMFVGQRKDPFVINVGEIFDLVNLDPTGPPNSEADDLADKNVSSIILEIPAAFLVSGSETVIGGWTTASLRRIRVLEPDPTFAKTSNDSGDWIQVSRLGMPLVNEVVIGLKDKNRFNSSRPLNDAQFLTYVTNPTVPELLKILFNVTPPCLPRQDLVQIYLTGLPGVNQPANVVPSEMLRLQLLVPPTPKGQQNRLGFLGGDSAGFPNGRRPGDDVVDITLRAAMGAVLPAACAPSGQLPFTDGAYIDDSYFSNAFPYLLRPLPGSPN